MDATKSMHNESKGPLHNESVNIALGVAFRTTMAISRQNEARSQDYALLLAISS